MLMQAYEFISMIQIIQIQQKKSLSEIMYEINNQTSYKTFLHREIITKRIFVSFVAILFSISLTMTYFFYAEGFSDFKLMVLFITEVLMPYFILCISLTVLLIYMDRYHHYEKKIIQGSLLSFVLFESFDLVVYSIQSIFNMENNQPWTLFTNIDLYIGGYIFL